MAAITLEEAIAEADAVKFSDRIVGSLLRRLTIEVSTEAAATFFGYAMRVWEDQRRR